MKNALEKFVVPMMALALGCAPWQGAFAQSPLLMVNDAGVDSVKDKSFKLFAKIVDEKLPGKFKINVSENDALYNQEAIIPATQLGAIKIASPGTGLFGGQFPKTSILTLPYLLPTPQSFQEAVDDPKIGGVIFSEMRQKGMEPMAVWLNGPREVGRTGDKPILWPDDMKGVKIRVAPAESSVNAFKILGANVTTMSFSQVPTALRQGVLDAVEPTPNAWVSSHLYEIARHVTKTGYIWDTYIVIANKPWLDALPADQRAAMKDAMAQATKWNWENVDADNDHALQVMKQAGVNIYDLTPEQLAAWKKAEQPLWHNMGDKLVGADVVDRIVAIGQKYH